MWIYFKKLLQAPFTNLLSADTIAAKIVVGILTFFAPVKLYAISIFMLVLIDVVTGIWASYKKGEPFKSRILRKGLLEKLALYGMLFTGAIVMGKVLQSVIHYETFYIAWVFTILVSVYELSSIIENIIVIKPELSFLNKLKSLLTKVQDKQLDKVEEMQNANPEVKNKD